MEHQKILILLNEANHSKFATRKWNIVNDNSKSNYDATNKITSNTEISNFNLCDYNFTYILRDITVTAAPTTQLAFQNCASFAKFITKIDGKTINDAENLDLVMPMYNLMKYSSNYSETMGSLWLLGNYKLLGNVVPQPALNAANVVLRNVAITVPLIYLSNFWRSL